MYQMAKLTGGGFTNLPADRGTLVAKLDAVREILRAAKKDEQAGDLYMFVLEDPKTRKIRGTCQVFGQVGVVQPFYSLSFEHADPDQPRARQDLPQPAAVADHRPRRLVRGRRPVPPSRDRAPAAGARCSRAAAICS